MQEKKLTDEELIRLLEVFANDTEKDGITYLTKNTLDFINRQKAEVKRAQKASEYAHERAGVIIREKYELALKNTELQKQVEYWENETKIARRDIDEAVKDTAKAIFTELLKGENVEIVSRFCAGGSADYYNVAVVDCNTIKKLAKRKGVEIEQ